MTSIYFEPLGKQIIVPWNDRYTDDNEGEIYDFFLYIDPQEIASDSYDTLITFYGSTLIKYSVRHIVDNMDECLFFTRCQEFYFLGKYLKFEPLIFAAQKYIGEKGLRQKLWYKFAKKSDQELLAFLSSFRLLMKDIEILQDLEELSSQNDVVKMVKLMKLPLYMYGKSKINANKMKRFFYNYKLGDFMEKYLNDTQDFYLLGSEINTTSMCLDNCQNYIDLINNVLEARDHYFKVIIPRLRLVVGPLRREKYLSSQNISSDVYPVLTDVNLDIIVKEIIKENSSVITDKTVHRLISYLKGEVKPKNKKKFFKYIFGK